MSYEIPDKVRIPVDRLNGLDQRPFAWFIQASHPKKKGLQIDEKDTGGLFQGPAPGCPELQDPHALDRQIVWPASGFGTFPAGILDVKLFTKESDLGGRLLQLGAKAIPGGRSTTGVRQGEAGQ